MQDGRSDEFCGSPTASRERSPETLEDATHEPHPSGRRMTWSFLRFESLLAEMGERIAQRSAGDFYQPVERLVHLQDQEE